MQKPNPVPSILLFVSAAVLLFCAFGTSWYKFDDDDGGVGLLRMTFDGRSEWMWKEHIRLENLLAILTGLLALGTAVCGVIAGISLLKPGKSPLALVTLILSAMAIVFGIAFTVKTMKHMGVGAGFYLFWLASIASLVSGILGMTRAGTPAMGMPMMPMGYPGQPPMMQQPYGAVPMGGPVGHAPMAVPCNTCGGPTMLVAQYNRHFCQRCNRYL